MAKDAFIYLIPLLILAGAFWAFGIRPLAAIFLILSLFIAFFFRDPDRAIPQDPHAVVSPADGKVIEILQQAGGRTRVSIFLSVFDVHINRAPVEGVVESIRYTPGKFLPAFQSTASGENERNNLVIDQGSYKIEVSQIAGILARRIVCWKKVGDRVQKGERFGLIKFGSRVDVFLPGNVILAVKKGDRVKGGSTLLGRTANG
ncbi:MAG: phosphatidylserine decarboxylase family protein [Terriglobia bacterium]